LNLNAGASASVSNLGELLRRSRRRESTRLSIRRLIKGPVFEPSHPTKPTKDALNFERGNATFNDAKLKDANFKDDADELVEPAGELDIGREETLRGMMGIRELDSMEGETRAVNEPKGSSDRSFRSPMAHLGLRNATLNFHQRIVGTAIQKEKSFVCCCGREAVAGIGRSKCSVPIQWQYFNSIRSLSLFMLAGPQRRKWIEVRKYVASFRRLGR